MVDKPKPSDLLDSRSDLRTSNVVEEFGAQILDFVHRSDRDAIIFYATDGDIEYANERALDFLGAKQLVGLNYFDLRDDDWAGFANRPEFGDEHHELVRRALAGEETRGEFMMQTPNDVREVEVLYGPVYSDDSLMGVLASYRDVTGWRQMNELVINQNREIEMQREFLASVLDLLDDGVFVLDSDKSIVLVNPTSYELLGIDPERTFDDVDSLLRASNLMRPTTAIDQIDRALRDKSPASGIHLTNEDSTFRCLELSISYHANSSRNVICRLRDLTEWQQVRQFQLLASIGRLGAERHQPDELATKLVETIFEQLSVDIAILALFDRGRLRPVVWRGVMLEPEFIVDPLTHPDVQEALSSAFPVESDGAEWDGPGGGMTGTHYVVPLIASGNAIGTLHLGSLQSVRLFSTPEKSFADPAATFDRVDRAFLSALGAYVAVALESTRLFAAAAEGSARLKALVERIPDGVVLFNARGEILLFNEAAGAIAEMEWRNLNSDSRPYRIRDIDGRPLPRGEWPFFQAVRDGNPVLQQELIFDFGDRRKHIEVNVNPVSPKDAHVPSFVGTLKDVTERSEQDRRKDEFLSVASHELRSPMTPLTGFIQMTRRKLERGEMPDIELIARAEYQVHRLSRLIDGLLDMTRIETGQMVLQRERVDLAELLFRTLDGWTSHPKDFELEFDIPRDQIIIASVDPVRIDQVLTNLVDNAVKHISPGGTVRVGLSADASEALVTVWDDGEGIPQGAIERIFDRFFQADGETPTGVGLGLYITREIVLQHGGDISIDSKPGEHTVVEIRLPLEPH